MLLNLTEMNNWEILCVSVAIVIVTYLYYAWTSRVLPPGPVGLPYLGYLPFLRKDTSFLQLQKLGEKYGSMFSFKIAGRLYINLGSIKAMKEALVTKSEYFQQRLDEPNVVQEHLGGGIAFIKGEPWKIIRKFLIYQFRERGMTAIKESISNPIYDTIKPIVTELNNKKGDPVDINAIFLLKGCTILRLTLFGSDGISDEELYELIKSYSKMIRHINGINLLMSGNFFKYFYVPFSKGMKKSEEGTDFMKTLLMKVIERRKSTYDDTIVRDIIDGFIKERNIRKSKNDITANYFKDEVLLAGLIQFVGDGVLFLSFFLNSFISALIEHPEEQEKIYQELLEVVGEDRDPSMEDRSKLTYTNAFITEVFRTSLNFTYSPTLACEKETMLYGYRIPKGSILLYNFWMANMNPEDYEDPEKFNPSRFLITDRNKRPELPATFGMGKRACLGEGFATAQIYLYVTTLVKYFRLTKPISNTESPPLSYLFMTHYISAHPRKTSV